MGGGGEPGGGVMTLASWRSVATSSCNVRKAASAAESDISSPATRMSFAMMSPAIAASFAVRPPAIAAPDRSMVMTCRSSSLMLTAMLALMAETKMSVAFVLFRSKVPPLFAVTLAARNARNALSSRIFRCDAANGKSQRLPAQSGQNFSATTARPDCSPDRAAAARATQRFLG